MTSLSQVLLLALAASASLVLVPPAVRADCPQPVFEIIGNGVDDDCDGLTDEGASQCGSGTIQIPFTLDTSREFRAETKNYDNPQHYGNDMDIQWTFLPSQRMQFYWFGFDRFDTEYSYDYLKVGSETLTGTGHTGTWLKGAGSALLPMQWYTDYSILGDGVRFQSLTSSCTNNGSGYIPTAQLYQGIDGALMYTGDNAFFTFTLPAYRTGIINLDHMGTAGTQNYNIFVKQSSAEFAANCNSAWCGISASDTGETVGIGYATSTRQFVVNISSYQGAGRYRLFISAPVVSHPDAIDIGYEDRVVNGSAEDLRGRAVWGAARAVMLAATDGQFAMNGLAEVYNSISCYSCQDLIYSNKSTLTGGCAPGATYNMGTAYSYVSLVRNFWRPYSTWVVNGVNCWGLPGSPYTDAKKVAELVVHEWGHHEFWIPDEYQVVGGAVEYQCGHSSMAGAHQFGFLYGTGVSADTDHTHITDFCTYFTHGKDRTGGLPPPTDPSGWAYISSTYPQLNYPLISSDPSQLRRLTEVMHTAFTTFNYHF